MGTISGERHRGDPDQEIPRNERDLRQGNPDELNRCVVKVGYASIFFCLSNVYSVGYLV